MRISYANNIIIAVIISLIIPASSLAGLNIVDQVVIYKEIGSYSSFPEISKGEDGTLFVNFSVRKSSSHYSGSPRNVAMVSKDKGKSWQKASVTHNNPEFKLSDNEYVVPFSKGWQFINSSEVETYKSRGIEIHSDRGNNYVAQNIYAKLVDSNGKLLLSQAIEMPEHSVLMTYNLSSYLRMKSGVRLRAFYGKKMGDTFQQPFIIRSVDKGKTWKFTSLIPSINKIGFNETALAELKDGRIIAVMRSTDLNDHSQYVSYSSDQGLKWTLPAKFGVTGVPANVISHNNYLIDTYSYRLKPMGVRVRVFSLDKLVPMFSELILRDDSDLNKPYDVGYPLTVSLGDGEFFTVYYITTDGTTHIAGTRWKITTQN